MASRKPGASRSKRKRKRSGPPLTPKHRAALVLVAVLVLAVVGAAGLSAPAVKDALFTAVGIQPRVQLPQPADGQAFGPVSVHFIDVGQGDAVLLEADGAFALIDAGPPEGEEALVAYLRAAGVQRLQYLVMTHPHADHIGGMQKVVEAFPVERALLPDFEKAPLPTTSLLVNLLDALAKRSVPAETARAGGVYPLGGGTLTVLQDGVPTEDNLNLLSLVTLFEAGGLRYLASGDGEKQNEQALLQTGQNLSANVYKAAHHGSSTSNTDAFVAAIRPALVVVCAGADNPYGHPHMEPLDTFAKYGATVLNTAEAGSVRVGPGADGALMYAVTTPAVSR